MKKLKYENVNEIRRSGSFTRNPIKTYENRMMGSVACPGGDEMKFFDVVMFRDKATGKFPWEDLFVPGKHIVFTGYMKTFRSTKTDKRYDEIVLTDLRENVPVEVDVPDEEESGGRPRGGWHRDDRQPRKLNPQFSQQAGLEPPPTGLFDDGDDKEF